MLPRHGHRELLWRHGEGLQGVVLEQPQERRMSGLQQGSAELEPFRLPW